MFAMKNTSDLILPKMIGCDDYGVIVKHDHTGKYYAKFDACDNYVADVRDLNSDEYAAMDRKCYTICGYIHGLRHTSHQSGCPYSNTD